ncbi:MAG: hypothetical protein H6668_19255, partial [Ardenticatenaceae bacterium]|nr:hypothetical protein [Ardenticatenaceae bacterium]
MRAEINYRNLLNAIIRLVLVAAILAQTLALPLTVQAASPRQQILAFKQQANESDDAYLERMAATQPELFQSAAVTAVQDAFNGNAAADEPLEAKIVSYLDQAVEEALANPDAVQTANTDGSFDDEGNYNWSSTAYDEQGNVSGAWQLDAQPKGDPAIFEEVFESKLAERGYITPAQSGEPSAAAPQRPQLAPPVNSFPEPFGPYAPLQAPMAVPATPLAEPTSGSPFPSIDPPRPTTEAEQAVSSADDVGAAPELSSAFDPAEAANNLPLSPKEDKSKTILPTNFAIRQQQAAITCAFTTAVYVKSNATGTNDGTNWANAYTNLNDGLTAAQSCGVEVWVAAGIYTPGTLNTDSFNIYPGIEVYGGFAGTETTRNQRDWQANPTILSGDMDGNDTTTNGVVTDPDHISGTNSHRIVYLNGIGTPVTTNTVLDGFTITGGYAASAYPYDRGAALFCDGGGAVGNECSPTLNNLTIIGNKGTNYGAMYNDGYNSGRSNPVLTDVNFTNNRALNFSGGAIYNDANNGEASPILTHVTFDNNRAFKAGGAIYNYGSNSGVASPSLTDVVFTNNQTTDASGSWGGAIYNNGGNGEASPTLNTVTFTGNQTDNNGGAIYNDGKNGGKSNPTLTDVTFTNNQARSFNGGAIFNDGNSGEASPTLTDVVFEANAAGGNGGALYNYGTNGVSSPSLANVIFVGNQATSYGGALFNYGVNGLSSPTLNNVLFSGNHLTSIFSPYYGKAILHEGESNSVLTMNNVTLSENEIYDALQVYGSATVNVSNTIFGEGQRIYKTSSAAVNMAHSILDPLQDAAAINVGANVIQTAITFVDADGEDNIVGTADDNLRLVSGSPAIDMGDNAAVPPSLTGDLDGNPRFYNDTSVPDTGSGTAPIVDAGAYEFQRNSCGFAAIFVDDSATGANDGSSWADAYTDLNLSIQQSFFCGQEVWVAEGIYTAGSDYEDSFKPASVILYGGFVGNETTRDQRDWETHTTILSGDIGGDDITANGVITTTDHIVGINSRRIVDFGSDRQSNPNDTILDGFILTGADWFGSSDSAVTCYTTNSSQECNPTLRNLKFIGNKGGGLRVSAFGGGKSNPTLENMLFEANKRTYEGAGMSIHAANFGSEVSPLLYNVTFYKNITQPTYNTTPNGGGLSIYTGNGGKANPTLNHVTFIENVASGSGGGFRAVAYGTDSEINPTLMDVKFIGNEAGENGGGIYFDFYTDGGTSFKMQPTLNSVLFSGNSTAAGNGGAIYYKSPDAFNTDYLLTLNNVTVSGNQASASGGGLYMNGMVSITNSIFWNNTANTSGPNIYVWSGAHNWSYSIIPGQSGTGIIGADPQFEDADGEDNIPGTLDDNFRLLEASPAVDAGDNSAVPLNAYDLDGNPRIMNSTVDMGAYEFTPWVTIPGLDGAVYDLAVTSSDTLFAAGAFSDYVASFDGTNWTTLPGLDAPVRALWLAGDNTLYAAGDFTGRVAQWTGAAWQAVGANPPAGTIKTLTRAADGTFYVGGDFGVRSFNPAVGGDWQAVGADISNVRAVAVYGGELYAGGDFNSGDLLGYMARWNGTAWQTVSDANNPTGLDKPVNAFTEYAGRLAIGGAFTAAADGLIFWDGHQYTTLSGVDNVTQDAEITDLYVTGGLLAVVGDFDEAGGDTAFDLAIWTGTRFITGVGGLYETNNRLEAIALVGGDLYAGGGFEKIGGRDTPNVGKLDPETADLRVAINAPTTLQWPTETQLTMTVTNDGATTVESATIGMWLPFGFEYVSSNSGNCSQSSGLVSCTITNLAAAASQSFVVTANIVNGANTPATVPAFAAATTLDSTPANNVAQASIDLTIDPDLLTDLGISLTTEAVVVDYQDVVTYTVAISNTGTGAGRDVLATITMPNGGLYQGASGATCTLDGVNALCDLDQINPNAGTTFDIYVQMNGNGTVRAQATIADQSSNPVTFDANTDNNSATSPPVLVFAENRTHRVVGNVVVAANSFETVDSVVTALGGVELGILDELDNPVYTIQLTGGLDAISWPEGVENGDPPPAGQPALSGHGSVAALATGLIYFVGDFQISDASVSTLAPVGNVAAEITELAGFNLDGGLTYTGISLADGSAAVAANIIITPPGISTTAPVVGQLSPDRSFSGTIPTLTLKLSALEIEANNLTVEVGTIRANTITITLPSALGGGTGNAADLLITPSYVRIGAVGAKIPLPNIPLANGQTLNITDVEATVGFFGGVYAVQAKGRLNITLPENTLAADVEFAIDGAGNIDGIVTSQMTFNLAGASLVLTGGLLTNDGVATDAGVLTLGNANVTVRQITITSAGLSIGANGAKIPFPDVRVGRSAVIHNLEAQLTVANGGGSPHYIFNLTGKTRILLPDNTQTVTFTGQLSQGALSGTMADFSLKLNGSTLRLVNMPFANGKFSLPTAQLTLPSSLSSRSITVNSIVIDEKGLAIDEGLAEVDLANIPLAGNSATVQLLLSGILYIETGSSLSFEVGGKLRVSVSGKTVDLFSTFTINSQGQINAEVPDFDITVVGLSITTDGVVLRNGVLQATEASLATPKAWGEAKAAVYDLRIGNGDFSLGGGEFALPPIDLGSVKFKVSGGFKREGSQLIIKAAGVVAIKNLPEKTPGCYGGFGVALTVYVDVGGNLVADVEPAPNRAAVAAASAEGNGFSATISAECKIPISGTGFSISKISGTFALLNNADVVRLELAVEFESNFDVLGEPAVASEPTLGIEAATDGRYMQIDFAATAEIFSMFTAAEIEAGLRVGQKKPGDADAIFKAELYVDMVVIKGEAYFAAWTQNGSFHLVGGGKLRIGVEKGDVWEGCIKIPFVGRTCISIPPFDLFLKVGTDFGEFQRGSGTTWGLKTYIDVVAYEVGLYINTSGDFRFGSVSQYQTVTPPDLLRAKELQQTVKAQRRLLASLSPEEQNLYNAYHFAEDATLIDFTVQHGDITINFGRAVQDTGLELRLIRPDGLEMTLNNLPDGMVAYSFPMEVENDTSEVEMIHTMISLTDAMPGVWQMKLIGADTATYGYILNAMGNTGGPTVDDLALTQLDDTHAEVAWSVSSAVPTTTLSIYATAGPITATETITVSEGVTDTMVVERYSGAPILANATTTLDGSVQTADIDFSTWESGEYWVWIDANDDMNPPTREYFPGKVIVEHPWAETWTASTVITPSFRTLDVAWNSHPNQDVDDYEVWITPDGDNFESQEAQQIAVGNTLMTNIRSLEPNKSYTVKVVAVDLDTNRQSASETSQATAGGAPFTLVANPSALTVPGGTVGAVALTLTTTEEPFPARVVLSAASETDDLTATFLTEVVTPTLAGVSATANITVPTSLASGIYTVTLRASAAGEVRLIDIPVTVQAPSFTLQGSPESVTLTAGATTSVDIDATYLFGEDDDIFVTLENVPEGMEATFDEQLFAVGEQVTLTLGDTSLLTNGSYTLTVVGNDGDHEETLDITVIVSKPTFGFSDAYSTHAQALHGQTVTYTVGLEGDDWETAVNLGFDSLSLGGYLTPTLIIPSGTTSVVPPATFKVAVTVPVSTTTPAGNYEMVLQATSEGITKKLPLHLLVGPADPKPDLRVSYELSASEVTAGDLVTLTVRYENQGAIAVNTDLGGGFSHTRLITASEPLLIPQAVAGCDTLVGGTDTDGFDGTYQCDAFGTLQPGDFFSRTTVYRVHEGATDGATATISEMVAIPNDYDLDDNGWQAGLTVHNSSDVAVALSSSVASQNAGEAVTYSATVKTNGPADASNTQLTLTLDEAMSVQGMSPACSLVAGVVSCEVGFLESGCERPFASDPFTCNPANATTTTMTVTVTLDPAATGSVLASATAS